MIKFTDGQKREWSLVVDVPGIKLVRELLNVNLLDVVESDLMIKLADDHVLLVDVLYVLCKGQADNIDVSDVEFGKGLGGSGLESATRAFMTELVDFFPNPKRKILKTAWEKMTQVMGLAVEKGIDRLNSLSAEALLQKVEETKLSSSPEPRSTSGSGGSPESLV